MDLGVYTPWTYPPGHTPILDTLRKHTPLGLKLLGHPVPRDSHTSATGTYTPPHYGQQEGGTHSTGTSTWYNAPFWIKLYTQILYVTISSMLFHFSFLSNTLIPEQAWNTSWRVNSTVNLKAHMFRVPWILSCLLQQLPVMARKYMKLVTLLLCHNFSLMLMFHSCFHNLHFAFSDNERRLVVNMFLLWPCVVVVMWLLLSRRCCYYHCWWWNVLSLLFIAWFKFSVYSWLENYNSYKAPTRSFSK